LVEPGSGRTRLETITGATEADEGCGVPYIARYALRLDASRVVAVEDTGRWYADGAGRPVRAHGTVRLGGRDTELAPGQRERSAFLREIAGEVAEAGRTKRPLTLFVLSLENLASLNDDLGFDGGDEVIREVLARMRTVMRRRDRFARYGGNRFALALRSCPPEQARAAAERLERVISAEPIETALGPVTAHVLIGAASAPDHALEPPVLLRRAEQSLAIAKRRVGPTFVLYDQKIFRSADRPALRTAATDVIGLLNARDIVLALQPVVEADTRRVSFSEALLRVREEGRVISAADVVPGMERSGLVPLVDMRILELAADHLAAHPADRLSINVSPLTLDSPDWLATLSAHLGSRPGIAPRLIVEVTETVAIREPDAVRRKLDLMKALGVSIAIDDFGAGHTSFKHLRNFAVDIVKIDGAFVQNLQRVPTDRFFVQTLIELAHHLGVSTVAEWVEDEETARLLARMGVDYLQGDHCGRPLVAGDLDLPRSAAGR
jgi:diguanylate cyclase (GGDEF)-like protein